LAPAVGAEAAVEQCFDGRSVRPALVGDGDHWIVLKRSGLTGTVAVGPVAQALLGTVKSPNPRANDGHAAGRQAASSSRNQVRQHHGHGYSPRRQTNNVFAGAVNGELGRIRVMALETSS